MSLQSSVEDLGFVSVPEVTCSLDSRAGRALVAGQIQSSNDIGEGAEGRSTILRKEIQMLAERTIYCKPNY